MKKRQKQGYKRYPVSGRFLLQIILLYTLMYPLSADTPGIGNLERESGRRPVVALVLAGGGALGFSHLGVIELIEELGIPVDIVTGTSMGAIVGGLFSTGYTVREMIEIVEGADWVDLFIDPLQRSIRDFSDRDSPVFWTGTADFDLKTGRYLKTGLVSGQKVMTLFSSLVAEYGDIRDFDELPRRFRAIATDLLTGDECVLSSGALPLAVRASMAFPGIFEPVEMNGRLLVDGGLANNFPVDVARNLGADIVIAVDLDNTRVKSGDMVDVSDVMTQTVHLVTRLGRRGRTSDADIVIAPDLSGFTPADFFSAKALVQAGREAAETCRAQLAALAAEIALTREDNTFTSRRRNGSVVLDSVIITGLSTEESRKLAARLAFPLHEPVFFASIDSKISVLNTEGVYRLVSYHVDRTEDERSILNVRVTPYPKADVSARFGYVFESRFGRLAGDQIRLSFNARFLNLSGEGSRLSLTQDAGRSLHSRVELLQPLFASLYARAGLFYHYLFTAMHESGDYSEQYRSHEGGGEAGFELSFREYIAVFAGYRFSGVCFRPLYGGEPDEEPFSGSRSGFISSVEYDSLDSFPFPDSGMHCSLDFSAYHPLLEGGAEYSRCSAHIRKYFSVNEQNTVGLHLALDTSLASRTPVWDSAWAGGLNGFFGYEPQSIRALQLVSGGLEYRFRFSGLRLPVHDRLYLSLRGSAGFYSRETIRRFPEDLGIANPGEYRLIWAIGPLVSLDTPLGALRAGVAFRDDNNIRLLFAAGQHF